MGNINKQDYNKFYQQYHDVKIQAFKICDKILEKSDEYDYLLSHYSNSSLTLGTKKIYVTYEYPMKKYKIGFSFPAPYVMNESLEEHKYENVEMDIFKT